MTTKVDGRIVRTRRDVPRAALQVLLDEGWSAVTHQHVAQVAGYSKATLYAHWPTPTDLITAAFASLAETPHHIPTGDLRADLISELVSYRTGMAEHRLDRALAVLSDLAHSVPELVEVRDRLVRDGEKPLRDLLSPYMSTADVDTGTVMLLGAMLQQALLHGILPGDGAIYRTVDVVLTLAARPPG